MTGSKVGLLRLGEHVCCILYRREIHRHMTQETDRYRQRNSETRDETDLARLWCTCVYQFVFLQVFLRVSLCMCECVYT